MENVRTMGRNLSSVCLFALVCVASSGCAKVYHAVHYNPVSLKMHDNVKNYYHSEKTGRIIPKDRCYCPEEPPCYGYEPTCWKQWPEDCPKCPIECECEQEVVIHEEIISTGHDAAMHSALEEPQPETALPEDESSVDAADALESESVSPSDATEPDYDEESALAPVVPSDSLTELKTDVAPVEKVAPRAKWLPGSTSETLTDVEDVEPAIEQPRSLASPATDTPEPTEPDDRRSSRRRRKVAVVVPKETKKQMDKSEAAPNELADNSSKSTAIPSFQIPVKVDSQVASADSISAERVSKKDAQSKVKTVSFR